MEPHGMYFETRPCGRVCRHLLLFRDLGTFHGRKRLHGSHGRTHAPDTHPVFSHLSQGLKSHGQVSSYSKFNLVNRRGLEGSRFLGSSDADPRVSVTNGRGFPGFSDPRDTEAPGLEVKGTERSTGYGFKGRGQAGTSPKCSQWELRHLTFLSYLCLIWFSKLLAPGATIFDSCSTFNI